MSTPFVRKLPNASRASRASAFPRLRVPASSRRAGEMLLEAKSNCQHGEWLPWLKANVQFSQPQAWRYIEFAKLFAANNLCPEEAENECRRSCRRHGYRPFQGIGGGITVGNAKCPIIGHLTIYLKWGKCTTVVHMGVCGVLEFLRTGHTGEENDDDFRETGSKMHEIRQIRRKRRI